MTEAFTYRPRFVDIRIKPEEAHAARAERRCDWAGCMSDGAHPAPMGPNQLNERYWFCPAHAAEYNRNWNFFEGMSEAEVADFQKAAVFGDRPTWTMRADAPGRENATRAKRGWAGAFTDPFGLFSGGPRFEEAPKKRRLGRLETAAFEALGLAFDADGETIRTRYAELVKKFHPDANGGDRSSEGRLIQVIRAYQTLKKAGIG